LSLIRVLSMKRRFDAIAKKSREEVEAIQQENIKSMLSYAISHSPFYKKLYQGRGVNELLKDGFNSIPFTDKQMIMSNFNSVVTYPKLDLRCAEKWSSGSPLDKNRHKKFTFVHTSGTSGKVGIFTYDRESWDTLLALCVSRTSDFSIRISRTRMAFMGLTDGYYGGVTLASSAPRSMTRLALCSVNEPPEHVVERLNKFQPEDLRGYPSGLAVLAQEQLAGRLNIKPRHIVSTAEPLDGKTHHLVEEAFGLTPYNFYATTEILCLAHDCRLHQGLHVYDDQNVVELVDKQGQPVEPGKPGEVVVTSLYNRCQPLIRYQLHDVAVYSEEECECGLPFPVLKAVGGRDEETIWVELANGSYEVIHPLVFVAFFVPGLRGMQVHQLERNRIKLMVVATGNRKEVVAAVSTRMKEILAGKGLQDIVEFEVELVESIPPDSRTGKTKMVISEAGRPKMG
jgi:phenylacetate-CoA ligase